MHEGVTIQDEGAAPYAHDEATRAQLRDFFLVYEAQRGLVDAAVARVVSGIPLLAGFGALHDERSYLERRERRRASERAAIVDGHWAPFLQDLRAQGVAYARAGLAFGDWFRLLVAFRETLLPPMQEQWPDEPRRICDAILGMDAFVDACMQEIGTAYLAEKEREIALAEGYGSAVFAGALDAIIVVDHEGRVRQYNPAAEALFGYSAAEALGQPLDELIVPTGLRAAHREGLRRFVEGEEPRVMGRRIELRAVDRAGRNFPVEIGLARVGSTEPPLIAGFIRDLTVLHRTVAAYRRHARDLERSNHELDSFAYVASHDLRAPLRDVDNLAQWVAEDLGDALPEGAARHLTMLQGRVRRMERLLDDLLQYSRAGRLRSGSENLELLALIHDVVGLASVPPEFRVEVVSERMPIHCPRAPLVQVLLNLITNAIKHHDRQDGCIEVRVEPAGEDVRITVSDDGPGIPPSLHARAFRMFEMLKSRDDVEGTGMGLALVKKVVERHGGGVELVSDEGAGAAFSFTWPRNWDEEEADL